MNLLDQLRERVDQLPEGDHVLGLKAVVQHIEVGIRHLERGQKENNFPCFTDAIYRTNQAFEGSLKEAYRVLAGKDPRRKTPNEIEIYLGQNNILRQRVLSQLRTYRDEWRNPSTHDYILDFDEAEALLAIVSVSGFAIVLLDQILERLSFLKAEKVVTSVVPQIDPSAPLDERVVDSVSLFAMRAEELRNHKTVREAEVVGLLAGFLTKSLPDLNVKVGQYVGGKQGLRADILVESDCEVLIVEIKRSPKITERLQKDALAQLLRDIWLREGLNTEYFSCTRV